VEVVDMANQIVLTVWDEAFLAAANEVALLRSAIATLKAKGVLVIAFTAGDRAELEPIRQQLEWTDPFVTESGSGIFTPVGHSPFAEALGELDGPYYVQELGCPYVQARAGLRVLANTIGHPLKGFGDFTVPQLQKFLGISEDAAHRAKAREFSEPFMTPKAVAPEVLVQAAEEIGFGIVLQSPEENRFSQLTGAGASVTEAVKQVITAYEKVTDDSMRILMLGDFSTPYGDAQTVMVSSPGEWAETVVRWAE